MLPVLTAQLHHNGGSNVGVWAQEAVAAREQQFEEERQQVRLEREDAERKVGFLSLYTSALVMCCACLQSCVCVCVLSYMTCKWHKQVSCKTRTSADCAACV